MARSNPSLAVSKVASGTFVEPEVAEIAAVDGEGRAYVRLRGKPGEQVLARSVLDAPARLGDDPQTLVGHKVLLLFEEGDAARPIIVGLVRDELHPASTPAEFRLDSSVDRDVLVDGRRLVLDAQQEIVLRCGKSTIVLQRDGKVLIRGSNLLSRSSGPNKIKGGSISLN